MYVIYYIIHLNEQRQFYKPFNVIEFTNNGYYNARCKKLSVIAATLCYRFSKISEKLSKW